MGYQVQRTNIPQYTAGGISHWLQQP